MIPHLLQRLSRPSPPIFYIVFALSGFAGLVYESVWSRYLNLFLGHAAYAQSLVLIMFMGGLALGAWLVSRVSARIRRPIVAYAIVEAAIGIYALAFHPLYLGVTDLFYLQVAPAAGSPAMAGGVKWLLAALVITPPSVLLGATFPLMSAGLVRVAPDRSGRILSWLYATNSFGAAVGVLAAGFWFIAVAGLPGSMAIAGVINLVVAVVSWFYGRGIVQPATEPSPSEPAPYSDAEPRAGTLLLWIAGLTGLASFIYEIVWIRMLSLVLGSANHAFELMLSAFILGLAIGSFWIRSRADSMVRPLLVLGIIQVVMGTLAVGTLAVFDGSFEAMAYTMQALARSDEGYVLFNLFSHGMAMAVMLPVTICAGMTLPLITHVLIRQGEGEASIGRVYAMNTFGAIAGVLLAVHILMPITGIRTAIMVGGAVDILAGVAIALRIGALRRWRPATGLITACVLAAVTGHFAKPTPEELASGVYRTGVIHEDIFPIFHRDGKTASVDLFANGSVQVLATNGKPDASVGLLGLPSPDDSTQIMLGALPRLLRPGGTEIAVIGLGSGRTTHTLLADPAVERVDTIEIEPAMRDAAMLLGDAVARTFEDPRSHIHIDDARAFLAESGRTYDVIVSEPSNPWVGGVSGLFSREFYQRIKPHIADDGLMVQWLQLYEFDARLLASVMGAIEAEFADYAVYVPDNGNVLIAATPEGSIGEVTDLDGVHPALLSALRRIDVSNSTDLDLRRLGDRRRLSAYFASFDAPANSDFHPFLDLGAVRARYLRHDATQILSLDLATALIDSLRGGRPLGTRPEPSQDVQPGGNTPFALRPPEIFAVAAGEDVAVAWPLRADACAWRDESQWMEAVGPLVLQATAHLGAGELRDIRDRIQAAACRRSEMGWVWLDILDAAERADPGAVLRAAREHLQIGIPDAGTGAVNAVVITGMAAALAADRPEDARELYDTYSQSPFDGALSRYLLALADSRMADGD